MGNAAAFTTYCIKKNGVATSFTLPTSRKLQYTPPFLLGTSKQSFTLGGFPHSDPRHGVLRTKCRGGSQAIALRPVLIVVTSEILTFLSAKHTSPPVDSKNSTRLWFAAQGLKALSTQVYSICELTIPPTEGAACEVVFLKNYQ